MSNPVETYINTYSGEVKKRLNSVREVIRAVAPETTETIGYGMPTYKLNGKNMIHFAAFKHHIGLYPTPSAIEKFDEALKPYKTSKGAIQFQHSEPLPLKLIREIAISRKSELE